MALPTLPEGEKDNWLDHEELEHGAVGAEQLPGGEIKQEEGIEGQADRDVVDDGHIQVTAGNTEERAGVRQNNVRSVDLQVDFVLITTVVGHPKRLNRPLEMTKTIKGGDKFWDIQLSWKQKE